VTVFLSDVIYSQAEMDHEMDKLSVENLIIRSRGVEDSSDKSTQYHQPHCKPREKRFKIKFIN
jgi:hypothetical protein